MSYKEDLMIQLINLCNNNTPVNLKSLLNTINEDKEYVLVSKNIREYKEPCSLDLYIDEQSDTEIYAINASEITIKERWENIKYYLFFTRTDLVYINILDDIDYTVKNKYTVNIDDEVYILCITKTYNVHDYGDIANIDISQYPGDKKWKYIKRKELTDIESSAWRV